jgi:hypothetical protein
MKYLKYFESERQFREVDLQGIWDGIQKYYKDIIGVDRPVLVDSWYYNRILIPLLQDKEIEFKRAVHPADKEVIYGHSGRVQTIKMKDDNRFKNVMVSLYSDKNINQYILGSIDTAQWMGNMGQKTLIVKIYDSEPLEIEDKLKYISMQLKYNI